jgi:hypothetical protein
MAPVKLTELYAKHQVNPDFALYSKNFVLYLLKQFNIDEGYDARDLLRFYKTFSEDPQLSGRLADKLTNNPVIKKLDALVEHLPELEVMDDKSLEYKAKLAKINIPFWEMISLYYDGLYSDNVRDVLYFIKKKKEAPNE